MERIKEIECILTDLVSFAKDNTFNINTYEKYALNEVKAFNRLFPKLNHNDQSKVLDRIDIDFYLDVEIVLNMMGVTNINEASLKNRYAKLKRIFLNHIQVNKSQDQPVKVTEHRQNTILENLELVAISEISITDFIIRYKSEIMESSNSILSDINLFLSDLNNYNLDRQVEAVSELFEMKLYVDRMELYEKHSKEIPKLETPNPFRLIKKINNENYLELPEYINDIDFNALKDRPIERIEELRESIKRLEPKKVESKINQPQQSEKPKLTINQIALIYVYSGLRITRANGNKIARDNGHRSGEKLFQRFTFYSSAANRKGEPSPCTPTKLDNKIELIEGVIALLPDDKKQRAKDEVLVLKNIQERKYK